MVASSFGLGVVGFRASVGALLQFFARAWGMWIAFLCAFCSVCHIVLSLRGLEKRQVADI